MHVSGVVVSHNSQTIVCVSSFLGSPLGYHTLIFDLMSSRNIYLYNAYIYTDILFKGRLLVDRRVYKNSF